MGRSSAGARALSSTRNSSTLRFAVAPPRLPQRWAQSTQDPQERGAQRERVKQWAIETLQNLDAYKEEDVLLSISEVQCFEPGCSPIDLVFSVFVEGKVVRFKVPKPLLDVTEEDVRHACTAAVLQSQWGSASDEVSQCVWSKVSPCTHAHSTITLFL